MGMNLLKIATRVFRSSDSITIRVDETGNNSGNVEVDYLGHTHRGVWIGEDPETGDGPSIETDDDHDLLMGAMNAWEGENEFTVTPEELSNCSGGWWSL